MKPLERAVKRIAPRGACRHRLCVSALLAVGAALALALTGCGTDATPRTAFLDESLGASAPEASLARRVAPGAEFRVTDAAYIARLRDASVRIVPVDSRGAGQWKRFIRGATRTTEYGHEAVTFQPGGSETFAVVEEHQGVRTWQWRLETTLRARLGSDGSVGFLTGHRLTEMTIAPVAILNGEGRDITPKGLRWSVSRREGAQWLELRLDDTALPLPYAIDPAVTFRVASGRANAASTSATLNVPAGIAVNDVMIAQVVTNNGTNATITPPAGWTLIRRDDVNTRISQSIYRKLAGASESGTYVWTMNSSNSNSGGIVAYSGVDMSAPVDVQGATSFSTATTSVSAPSVTTTVANDVVIGLYASDTATTFTPPAGLTERWDQNPTTTPTAELSDVAQAVAGATGVKTATSAASARGVGALVALKPDVTPPTVALGDPGTPLRGASVGLTGTASDAGSGVVSVLFQRSPAGAGTWTAISTDTTSPYAATLDTTALSDGNYDIRAVATDVAGNTANSVVTSRLVDNTAPTGTITAPTGGAFVRGTISVSSDSADSGSGMASAQLQRSPSGVGTWTTIATDTTSPYSANLDTTGLTNGAYDFRVITTDVAGNAFTSGLVTATVDNTAPTGSITAPISAAVVRGTIGVTTNSADVGSSVASVTFERSPAGAGTWTAVASDTTSPYSVSLATTALTNGGYDLRATTTDQAGNTFTSALVGVTVDNTAPVISLTDPGTPLRGSVGLSATSSDVNSSVASVEFQRSPAGAGTWTSIVTDTTGPYGATLDTTALTDGSYDLRALATDAAGNTATSVVSSRIVDNTNPTGSPTTPTGGAVVAGTTAVSSNSADGGSGVAQVTFQRSPAGAGTWTTIATDTTSPYTTSLDTTTLTNGGYDLRAVTTDGAGNTFTSTSVTITVDNTAPTVSLADPGTPIRGPSVSLTATAGDVGSSLTSVVFQRSPASAGTWTTISTDPTSPYAATLDTTALTDGSYDLRAVATDAAGTTSTSTVSARVVDNTNPTGALTTPADGAPVRGTIAVSSSSADAGSGVASVAFQRSPTGAGTWTTIATDTTSPYSATLDTTALTNAGYDLRAVTTDAAGNAFTSPTRTMTVDNTAPTVTLGDPGVLSGTRALSATASDTGGSGVTQVVFERSPAGAGTWTSIATDTTSPYSASFGTTAVADGSYDLRAVVSDAAGNTATSTVSSRTVDNANPTGSLTSPANAAIVSGTITVSSDSADPGAGASGVASVVFQRSPVGAGTWTTVAADTTAPYSALFDTTAVTPGGYDLRAVTTDVAGNTFTSPTRVITVSADALTVSLTDPGAAIRGTVNLTATASDPIAGVASVAFQYSTDSGATWTTIATDTTSPYAASFDTTLVANGSYQFRARATSNSTTQQTSTVSTTTIDNTTPVVSLTNPGATLRGTVGLDATASDGGGSGVAAVVFQRSPGGAGTWTTIATDTSSPYSASLDTTALTDGSYDLRAVVTDGAGNTATSVVSARTVDNTSPAVALSDPGTALRATVSLSATASDGGGSGVAAVAFQRSPAGAGTWTTITTDATSPYSASLDTTALTDGSYDLRAVVTDGAGNTATSTVTARTVDNTNPTGSLTAPTNAATFNGTIAVSSDSADAGSGVAQVVFQRSPMGTGTWTAIATDTTSPYSVNLDTTALSNGGYDLRAITTDAAGNTFTSSTRTITVDNTNPSVTLTDPGTPLRGTVGLSATAADVGSSVAQVVFQRSPAGAETWTTISTDSTFAYAASLDTTGLTDGNYDLRAIVTDAAGNSATSLVAARIVDNTNPTGSLTAPANGAAVTGTIAVSSNSADPGASASGVASVAFQRSPSGAETWTTIATDTTSPYSTNLDTTALGDGVYDLRAITTDTAGNAFTSGTRTITVDNTNPVITLTNPGAALRATVSLTATATDATSGVTQVVFERSPTGAGTWTTIATDTTSPYGGSLDTTALTDGSYDLRAVATDAAGNTATSVLAARVVDNTNSTGSLTAPANGAVVNGTISVSANSADAGSGVAQVVFERSLAGAGTWTAIATDTASPYSVSLDTTAITSGDYDLRAITTDAAGNTFTSFTRTVTADNTNPTVTLTDPGTPQRGTVALSATAADVGSSVTQVVFERSPAGAGTWTAITTDSTSPYAASLDTTALTDGSYDLRAVVTDGAGNTAVSVVASRTVDNTSPSVSLADPGSPLTATVGLTATSSDVTSSVTSVAFQRSPAGAGTWTTISTDTSSPHAASLDTTALTDGSYDFRALATDTAGNTATSTVGARLVDNTGPSGSLIAPANGAAVNGTITVSSDSADAGAGVSQVAFQRSADGGATWTMIATDTTSPYSTPLNTALLTDGAYQLRAVTTDGAGLSFTSPTRTVTVDNANPIGALTAPADGAAVNGTIAVASNSADAGSGVASVAFQRSPAGAGTWTTISSDATSPYSVNLDTTALTNGAYDLRAVTTDAAGNTFTSPTRTITADNTAPSVTFTDPGSAVSGTVNLTATASDSGSSVASVAFQYSSDAGATWTTTSADTTSPYSASLDTAVLAAGSYQVRAVVTDAAGNTTPSTVFTTTVDNTAPAVSLTDPGVALRGTTVALSATATDTSGSGVTQVVFQRSPAGSGTWTTITTDTTSPYSATLDTTALTDGSYDLRAVATDGAGNTATSLVSSRTIDNTNPSGSLTAPANGAVVAGTIAISSNSADARSGIASVVFQRSFDAGATWTTIATDTASPYTVNLDTTGLADANHDLRAITTDAAGNTFTSPNRTITVDNTAPTVTFVNPGAAISGTVNLTATASDSGSSVASVAFQFSNDAGATWTTITTDITSPFAASFDTTTLGAGTYSVRAVVTDAAGTQTPSTVFTTTIDNTNPTGSLTAPANNAVVNGTIAISSNSADAGSGVASVAFQRSPAGAGTWTTISIDTTSPYSASLDTTALTNGDHDVRAITTDGAGNTFTSATRTITADNTNPTGSLTSPDNGAVVNGTIAVNSNSADAGAGVATVVFQRSPAGAGTWTTITTDTTSPYSASLDTTALTNGDHDLRAITTDGAGNTFTSATRTIIADNTNPTITFTNPGTAISGTVNLTATASDSGSSVASVAFQYSSDAGATWTTASADTTSPYSASLDTTVLTAGSYQVRAVVTDAAGNQTASAAFTTTIDNTNPTGSLTAPANGAVVADTIAISSNSADAGSGIASVAFQRSPAGTGTWTTISIDTTSPYAASLDTTILSNGDYDLRAVTTDAAGNTFTSPTRTITADNAAPTVTFTDPGTAISGTVNLTATASDAGSSVASVAFQYSSDGGATWTTTATETTSPYSASFDTTALTAGTYKLRAVVTDAAGTQTASAVFTTTVDNTNPTGSLTAPADGATVNGTIVITSNPTDAGSGIARAVFQRSPAGANTWTTIATDTTSPYSASLDTTALTNGVYDLRAVTTDTAGNTFTSATRSITADNSAPTVALTDPGTPLGGTIGLSASASDVGTSVTSVVFERSPAGAGTWTAISTDPTSPYTASLDTTALADGSYDLRAVATDLAGNTTTSTVAVRVVDNTNPTGSLTAPANGAATRGTIAVAANSADAGSGVASVVFQRSADGGATWTAIGTDTTSPYQVSLDTTALPDGSFDLRAVTTDRAGNSVTSSVRTITVDNAGPTASLADPGANLRGTVGLSATATDTGGSGVTSVLFERSPTGAGSWTTIATDTTTPYAASLDTPTFGDGSYDLRATATDAAGNQTTSLVTARTNDNTNPTGSLTAPNNGATVAGTISLSSNSSDAGAGVTQVVFERSPAAADTWTTISTDTTSPYAVSLNTTPLTAGNYDLRAVTTDAAGNTFTSPIRTITVDPNATSVSMTNPGANLRGTVNLQATAIDSIDGIASVTFERSSDAGATWTTISTDTTSPYAASLDTTGSADGSYQLRAVATSNASNTAASSLFSVVLDNTAPSVTFTDPGGAASGTVNLTAIASDSGSSVASVAFQYSSDGGATWTTTATDTTSSYAASLDTTGLTSGTYRLRAFVTDAAGNTTASSVFTTTVDNTAAAVSLTDPGSALRGTNVALSATATDTGGSGVTQVAFQRSPAAAGTWTTISTDTTSPYSASLDTTALADGNYDLRAVATDAAGNTATSLVTSRTIDNTNPTGSLTTPANGAAVAGTIAITSNSADAGSGVASVAFQRSPTGAGTWTTISADTTSPYGASLDTSGLSNDDYDLRAITTDTAGNTFTSAIRTITADNTNPTITFTNPGTAISGTVNLTATASDSGSSVASVAFQYSGDAGATWTTITTDTTSAYAGSFDTTVLNAGTYSVRAVVTDAAGNQASSAVFTTTVDNTNPTGSLTAPANGAAVNGTITITSNSADTGSGVATVAFQRSPTGAGTWTTITTDTTSPYSALLDTSGLPNGDYDIRAITTDTAGNTFTSATRTVTVDNTAPTVTFTDPGTAISGTVNLTATASDSGSSVTSVAFQYSSDGGATWTTTTTDTASPYSGDFDTTALASGTYKLRALVTDAAGNATPSTVVTTAVDNTNPTGALTAPADGAAVNGTIAITSNSADAGSGVASVAFQRSPTGAGTWTTIATDTTSPYGTSLDTSGLSNGSYDLRAVTTDAAANTFTSPTRTVTVDNTAPTVTFTSPGAAASGTVTLTATASDSGSSVASVAFQYSSDGGATWTTTTTDTTSPYSASFDTTALTSGTYKLRALVTDAAGNQASSAVFTTTVDNTNPTGSLTAPANGAAVNGTITITSNSADTGSGVATVAFQRSPTGAGTWTTITTDTTSPYSALLDTSGLPNGDYDIRAITTDTAGNTFTSPTRAVTADNTAPTGSLTSPANAATLAGTISVTTNSADTGGAGVAQVAFQRSADGGATWTTFTTDTTSPYAGSLTTGALAPGLYSLRAVTTDAAGNASTSTARTITVDPTVTTVSLVDPGAALSGVANLTATASDTSTGIAQVAFQRSVDGGATWTTIFTDTTSPYAASLDTTALAGGNLKLRAVATSDTGNQAVSAVRTVIVDNGAPAVNLGAPAAATSGALSLTATASDAGSSVAQVAFQYSFDGGVTWTTFVADTAAPFAGTLDTTVLAAGSYQVRAVATDAAGNSTSSPTSTVVVERTAPTASLTSPAPGAAVSGSVTLQADAADVASGVASVVFQRSADNGATWTTITSDTTSPYTASLDTPALADGAYDLRVIATDGAGNARTSVVRSITVDNAAPTVVFTPPATLTGSVSLSATASDTGAGVASVAFQYSSDGGATWITITTDTTSPFEGAFDTSGLPNSTYTLRAVVTDTAGNTASSASVNATIDNTARPAPPAPPAPPAAPAQGPGLGSSTPRDGSAVTSANGVTITATKPVATTRTATLNGAPISAPTITGGTVSFPTGALAPALYTLSVELVDADGNAQLILVHFTVLDPAADSFDVPPVERNTSPDEATIIDTPGGEARVTMPGGAWKSPSGDWVVLRVQPDPPAAHAYPRITPGGVLHDLVDVSASWAKSRQSIGRFDRPLDILIHPTLTGTVTAARVEAGRPTAIRALAQPGVLPDDWTEGYFIAGDGVHILSRTTSLFGLVYAQKACLTMSIAGATVASGPKGPATVVVKIRSSVAVRASIQIVGGGKKVSIASVSLKKGLNKATLTYPGKPPTRKAKALVTIGATSVIREALPLRTRVEIPFDRASKSKRALKVTMPKEKLTAASTCVTLTVGPTKVTKKAGKTILVSTQVSIARGASLTVSVTDAKGTTVAAKMRKVTAGVTFSQLKISTKAKAPLRLVVVAVGPGERVTKTSRLR